MGTTAELIEHRRYHHGDLPNALRRAAAEVIVERGLGNFSLREVARRAGVSHTAPAHHFGDMQGLLTSLATEGFTLMAGAMQGALDRVDDAHPERHVERLAAMGIAYLEFAAEHPAHFDVMFRMDVVDPDDADFQGAGLTAFAILDQTVRELMESEGIVAAPEVVTSLCWSMVQGLVVLTPKLDHACEVWEVVPFTGPQLVRQFVDIMVNGLRSFAA